VRVLSVVHDPAHTGGGGLFDEVGIPAAGGVEPPPTELRLF
jgi:hypothetical protein